MFRLLLPLLIAFVFARPGRFDSRRAAVRLRISLRRLQRDRRRLTSLSPRIFGTATLASSVNAATVLLLEES